MRSLDQFSCIRILLKLFWDAGEHIWSGLTQHMEWSCFVLSDVEMACWHHSMERFYLVSVPALQVVHTRKVILVFKNRRQ